MRLSEAIRLGAVLKPQAFGAIREEGRSCALGAACDALGIRHENALPTQYPELHRSVKCPGCGSLKGVWRRLRGYEFDLEDVIVHLNDDHRWERERIADFVRKIESKELPALLARHPCRVPVTRIEFEYSEVDLYWR